MDAISKKIPIITGTIYLFFRTLSNSNMNNLKNCRWVLLTLLLFLVSQVGNAQISASQTSGCAPLINVVFSSPPGATNINWDFGDGTGSNLASPIHTYILPGSYTVVFTAVIAGNPVNYSLPITVYGKPNVYFGATPPLKGCVPLIVNFKDSSSAQGGAAIVQREWAYGDGGTLSGNNPNPSYTYSIGGAFTPTLKVTDANGCDSSYSRSQYINVSVKPNVVLSTNPTPPAACLPPLVVSFSAGLSTSNSTTGGGLTYLWNLGGGNTSTAVNPPLNTYTTNGVYPISLTVTDNNNCSATTTTNVVISAPVASFFAVGAVNDTVCSIVTFRNNSTGVSPFYTYGDGTAGTDTVHYYQTPGVYQVTLQVQSGTCVDDTTITIVVENIVAGFASNPSYSCSWPATIQYTNQSVNGSTYNWLFGDSLTSSGINPSHTYQNADTNQYTIYYDHVYLHTQLIATSIHGCKDTIIKTDSIFKPTARFMPNVSHGCAPLNVAFSDSSISKEPIVNYYWTFGDGAINNGTSTSVNHTYTTPGIYYVRLVITNSAGCKDTSYLIPIYVGEPGTPAFSVVPNNVCVDTPVQFTDLTPAADSAQYWHYSADGGIMSHCYTSPDPVWSFNAATGPQSVTLTTVYNGCEGTTTIANAITVNGPLAHITTTGNCSTPFTYSIIGTIEDADYWTWDFGDGTVINNSTAPNINHTYTAVGDYTVSITAYNNTSGCDPYVDTAMVNVRALNAAFSADQRVCANSIVNFNAGASTSVGGNCHNSYIWYWGDNMPPHATTAPVDTHTYQMGGNFQIKLVVRDINGCVDSVKRNISVYDIESYFKPNKLYGCMPLSVNFSDSSYSDTTITQWQWNFGDGTTSNLQNPSHTFTQTGVLYWQVQLVVTNALGCKDSMMVIIRPSIPDANFFVQSSNNICVGDSVKFLASAFGDVTYSWNFGNGTTSTNNNPSAIYNQPGFFNVSLTVTDSIGCTAILSQPSLVYVQPYPLAGFVTTADTLFNKCYPLLVSITDTSIVNIFGSRSWDLGNGVATVGNPTVGTIYQTPGTYTISLIETTTNGCSDTVSRSITVEGPVGNFNILNDTICKGQSITFSIKDTSDVLGYLWDFGDGTTSPGISPVTHTYNINPPSGTTNVSLVLWSPDSACTAVATNPIYIFPVIAEFSIGGPDSLFCLNEQITFTNTSTNATSNNWNFGDGTSHNGLTPPPHTFPAPGSYTVTLGISNSSTGCNDTISKTLIILPLPEAIAAGGDTCQGNPVQLSSSGGIAYSWSPATGLNNDTIQNPLATPNVSTNYTVTVTDVNGCTDNAVASVIIYLPPATVQFDTAMVIGQTYQLNVDQGAGYSYSWTPATGLSCTDCPNPVAQPLVNTIYSVTITDDVGCFEVTSTYEFEIKPITTIDVPTAFTPNGDGENDVIYVNGFGIKKLIEFKIYNRFGQLVYESADISQGWDGYYRGELQPIETYVYFTSVETWLDGEILTKKGSFNIIR